MIRFFRLALVVLVLCVVALLSALTTMHFAIHGAEVPVPDFRGLTVAEAMRKAAALDLNLSIDNRFYSAEMPSGRALDLLSAIHDQLALQDIRVEVIVQESGCSCGDNTCKD